MYHLQALLRACFWKANVARQSVTKYHMNGRVLHKVQQPCAYRQYGGAHGRLIRLRIW